MAFNGSQHFKIARPIVNAGGNSAESLATHKTLTDKDSTYQFLTNTTGAVTLDCILPAVADGLRFVIKNEGASHNFTIMEGVAVLETLAPGESAEAISSKTQWKTIK
jgi:hypothetical protein